LRFHFEKPPMACTFHTLFRPVANPRDEWLHRCHLTLGEHDFQVLTWCSERIGAGVRPLRERNEIGRECVLLIRWQRGEGL
jgi:hypothetical protein